MLPRGKTLIIEEGPAYTRDNSFRAKAEAHARRYRARVLQLTEYGKYGHFLADGDAHRGCNFLPSLRKEILDALITRKNRGKGVLLSRTTGNMLSSQAMCFNLFVPLNQDKQLASRLLGEVLSEPIAIERDIAIEYTPSNSIFGDQFGQGGVDCDALIRYVNSEGRNGLIVCETKYVEKEFSTCGFRNVTGGVKMIQKRRSEDVPPVSV